MINFLITFEEAKGEREEELFLNKEEVFLVDTEVDSFTSIEDYSIPAIPFQLSFQEPATPVMNGLLDLHDYVFFFIIIILSIVLLILIQIVSIFALNTNVNREFIILRQFHIMNSESKNFFPIALLLSLFVVCHAIFHFLYRVVINFFLISYKFIVLILLLLFSSFRSSFYLLEQNEDSSDSDFFPNYFLKMKDNVLFYQGEMKNFDENINLYFSDFLKFFRSFYGNENLSYIEIENNINEVYKENDIAFSEFLNELNFNNGESFDVNYNNDFIEVETICYNESYSNATVDFTIIYYVDDDLSESNDIISYIEEVVEFYETVDSISDIIITNMKLYFFNIESFQQISYFQNIFKFYQYKRDFFRNEFFVEFYRIMTMFLISIGTNPRFLGGSTLFEFFYLFASNCFSFYKSNSLEILSFLEKFQYFINDFYLNCISSLSVIKIHKFLKIGYFNHSMKLEIVWTLIPILVVGLIITPSFFFMYAIDEDMEALLTIRVTGHQWYRSYTYAFPSCFVLSDNIISIPEILFDDKYYIFPIDNNKNNINDNFVNNIIDINLSNLLESNKKNFSFDSYMIDNNINEGSPRLLATDNILILPKFFHVNCIVTSPDVLHSWALPSLGVKIDAVPGRLNRTDIFLEHEGMFFGQCSELRGVNHSFMPIQIQAVSLSSFLKFLI